MTALGSRTRAETAENTGRGGKAETGNTTTGHNAVRLNIWEEAEETPGSEGGTAGAAREKQVAPFDTKEL